MKIVTRAEALRQGLKLYFTGKPCKHGHICERRVSQHRCVECHKANSRRWAEDNLEANRSRAKSWARRNCSANRARAAQWVKDNRGRANATRAARKKKIKLRTPPWADLKAIQKFYEDCPEGHHVDHYYPLQGEAISGLHVLENLRHIPAQENYAKGNRMPEEFYG